MVDRVYPQKWERLSSGGGQDDRRESTFDPKEDTIPMYKEVLLVDDETDMSGTINQGIKIDDDHELVLFDRVNGEKKISELGGGSSKLTSQNANYTEHGDISYQTRDLITFANQKAGTYLINYTFHYGLSSSDLNFEYMIKVNDVTIYDYSLVLPDRVVNYDIKTSFFLYTLAADGDIVLKFDYRPSEDWGLAKVNHTAYTLEAA